LIVVIVILGVLAATALPKFIDMNSDAKAAAYKGVAGAATTAMNVNYAGCLVSATNASGPVAGKCVVISDCQDITNIMQGGLPDGYTVASLVLSSTVNGAEGTCTLTQTLGGTVTAPALTFAGLSAGH
jgi:MSHA pilin protein MshA